ncbi:ABC transporter substrate-binding protein [Streptomyces sp. NBC_01465]|uniref:ABC transporter substrate-binding protein n=1 Tax=Streptomyces sp. NBC_01465 TaxID=2903878 RepID=UPI002E346458|nr:extracellular solute-binding protein [Streptomyces sp. NBC_01465]
MNNTGQLSRRSLLAAAGFAGLAALTGCGSGDDGSTDAKDLSKKRAGAMEKYGVGDQFKATKALSFTMLHNDMPAYPLKKNWLFWQELTKRTGVTITVTSVPLADFEKKKSLLIGAGDAPLILPKTYHPGEVPFVASGAILPLSEYVDLLPNFQDKVKKWKLEAELDAIRQSDGKYYILPGLHERVKPGYSLSFRTDILARHNLALPTSWDEVYEVLKALRAAYPDVIPFSDRWGSVQPAGALLQYMAPAFGTVGGWAYSNADFDFKAKKFIFPGASDGYRQMVEFLHKLVSEKLLDPEGFTQTDDQATQKLLAGKSFAISANPQELAANYRYNLQRQIKGSDIQMIPTPTGPAGSAIDGTRLENGLMISTKATKREDFVAMMQFIDWLWYSDAGQEFAKYGVEGVTYTKPAPGQYKVKDGINFQGSDPGAAKDIQKDYGFTNGEFTYGGNWSLVSSSFTPDEKKFQDAMGTRTLLPIDPAHPLESMEQEQATLWETSLKDHVTQNTLKFALGKRPLSEWDAYVSELKAKNMDRYIALHNKAYERFRKEHG